MANTNELTLVSITNNTEQYKDENSGKWVECLPKRFRATSIDLKFLGNASELLKSTTLYDKGYCLGKDLMSFAKALSFDKLLIVDDDEKYFVKKVIPKGQTKPVRHRHWESDGLSFTWITVETRDEQKEYEPSASAVISL